MAEEKERPQAQQKARRFRIARRVKTKQEKLEKTWSERELEALEEDDADRGTPEMNAYVNQGCAGCYKVTLLMLVIMIASIIGTCIIRR